MAFRLVQSKSAHVLWETCSDRFLDELGGNRGPDGFASHLWITHRNLRDLLFERAYDRGIPGWLGPPVSFFSDLPQLFDIRLKPVGPITSRGLIRHLSVKYRREIFGLDPGKADGMVRGHMLDGLFGDLLPEGVPPDQLGEALAELGGDKFAEQRNDWIVQVYAGYLAELQRLGVYDRRSIHALIAERIESGGLNRALSNAGCLHIYGIYNLGNRQRMFEALSTQADVDVVAYVGEEPEPSELVGLANDVETVSEREGGAGGEGSIVVQPAPDSARELDWVAREVKKLLVAGKAEPHEIAVIARRGQADTRRAYRLFSNAGLHCTARIRTPLVEVPVLKALLSILRAAAAKWNYRALRSVCAHPYFDIELDLQSIDHVSQRGRVEGLDRWEDRLSQLATQFQEHPKAGGATGLSADTVGRTLTEFRKFRAEVENLDTPHTEAEWLDLTLRLAGNNVLNLRRRLFDVVGDRWDIVRSDQRGLMRFERLLTEWGELEHGKTLLDATNWCALVHRILDAEELVVSTPMQKGVQIQEAHDAALVPFRHAFVIHANDGEFPQPPRVGGVLTDEERVALQKAGLPISHREGTLRRERALWRAVTLGSDVRISYRTTDSAGKPLLASMMVPDHDSNNEIPRARSRRVQDGSDPRPINEAQANELAALRLAAQLDSRPHGESATVAPANLSLLEQAIVGAVAEGHRDRGTVAITKDHPVFTPNPWNGAIRDPVVLDYLAQRFDDDYPWSAGQLELYSKCPFVFFVSRVLRLGESAEAGEELSALGFGSIAHDLLEQFYREIKDSLPVFLEGQALRIFDRIAKETVAQREAKGEWLGLPALWPVTKSSVLDCVRAYIGWELEYLDRKGEVPRLIEHRFGFEAPCVIRGGDIGGNQVKLCIRGRIDRVDSHGDGDRVRHHVLDYKLGSIPRKSGYQDGSVLQGPIYLRVVGESGLPVGKCRYRSIGSPGKPQNGAEISVDSADFNRALSIAFSIPERVRAGLFEATLAAKAGGWPSFYPGREICRSQAKLEAGTRFDA